MLHGECLSHFVSPFCLNKWWIEKAKKHNSYNKESNERVKKKKITKIEKEQTERGVWKNPLKSAFRQPPIIVLSWSCESAHIALYVAKSPTVDIYTKIGICYFYKKGGAAIWQLDLQRTNDISIETSRERMESISYFYYRGSSIWQFLMNSLE